MESFHAWKAGKWAILLSHPADFSPVCTSEVCNLASRYDEITGMNCLIATLSADPVTTHNKWLSDVEAIGDAPMKVKFPIIADENRNIAHAYAMIDPWSSTERNGQVPIRAAAIINPENRLMLRFNYPASVGRNMDEIVRCLKALQLSYEKSIATPANWPLNHSHLKLEDGSYTDEYKGSVYLLPTVSDEDAKKSYPKFHTCDVPSKIPYLRLVKLEDLGDSPALNVTSSLRCPANALMERAPMTLTPKLSLEQESGKTKPRNLYPEKSSDDSKSNGRAKSNGIFVARLTKMILFLPCPLRSLVPW
jgi:peroxiredoxin 6